MMRVGALIFKVDPYFGTSEWKSGLSILDRERTNELMKKHIEVICESSTRDIWLQKDFCLCICAKSQQDTIIISHEFNSYAVYQVITCLLTNLSLGEWG